MDRIHVISRISANLGCGPSAPNPTRNIRLTIAAGSVLRPAGLRDPNQKFGEILSTDTPYRAGFDHYFFARGEAAEIQLRA